MRGRVLGIRRLLGISSLSSFAGYTSGLIFLTIIQSTHTKLITGYILDEKLIPPLSLIGTLIGWLTFLLPLALSWRSNGWMNNSIYACSLGLVAGLLVTSIEAYPLQSNPSHFLTSTNMYRASGAVNACTATYTLLSLLRRKVQSFERER